MWASDTFKASICEMSMKYSINIVLHFIFRLNVSLTEFVDTILHRRHYDKFARPGLDFGKYKNCL